MLSVVIATHDDERGLLATLAALVPGATAGLVREVIVADAGSCEATAQIADVAGCRLVTAHGSRGVRLKLAADAARSEWLLFLQPGLIPDATWIDETRRFIERTEIGDSVGRSAAVFRPRTRGSTMAEAIALLRRVVGSPPAGGLLVAKAFYGALGGHRESPEPEHDFARRLGRRRIAVLGCTATQIEHNT